MEKLRVALSLEETDNILGSNGSNEHKAGIDLTPIENIMNSFIQVPVSGDCRHSV